MNNNISNFLSTLRRSPRTKSTYQYALQRFEEIVPDTQPTEDNFIRFVKSINDLSASTQQVWVTAVCAFYQFQGSVSTPRLREIAKHYLLKKPKTLLNFDMDAIQTVVQYCEKLRGGLEDLRDRAFILTIADTGLRISEACALKRGDINWKARRAIITGKGNKEGAIYFSNRAIDSMKYYLAERDRTYPPSRDSLATQPIFARHDMASSKKIRPIRPGGMWKAIKGDPTHGIIGRIEQAGIDRNAIRIHDFRHYFVTRIYEKTKDIKAAQTGARHESIATTNRYTHLLGDFGEIYDEVFN